MERRCCSCRGATGIGPRPPCRGCGSSTRSRSWKRPGGCAGVRGGGRGAADAPAARRRVPARDHALRRQRRTHDPADPPGDRQTDPQRRSGLRGYRRDVEWVLRRHRPDGRVRGAVGGAAPDLPGGVGGSPRRDRHDAAGRHERGGGQRHSCAGAGARARAALPQPVHRARDRLRIERTALHRGVVPGRGRGHPRIRDGVRARAADLGPRDSGGRRGALGGYGGDHGRRRAVSLAESLRRRAAGLTGGRTVWHRFEARARERRRIQATATGVGSDMVNAEIDAPWLRQAVRPAITWKWSEGAEPEMAARMARSVADVLREAGVAKEKIGIDVMDMVAYQALVKEGLNIVNGWPAMSQARVVKTLDELECHKIAAAHGDAAMWMAKHEWAKPGVRESEICAKVNEYLYRSGFDF